MNNNYDLKKQMNIYNVDDILNSFEASDYDSIREKLGIPDFDEFWKNFQKTIRPYEKLRLKIINSYKFFNNIVCISMLIGGISLLYGFFCLSAGIKGKSLLCALIFLAGTVIAIIITSIYEYKNQKYKKYVNKNLMNDYFKFLKNIEYAEYCTKEEQEKIYIDLLKYDILPSHYVCTFENKYKYTSISGTEVYIDEIYLEKKVKTSSSSHRAEISYYYILSIPLKQSYEGKLLIGPSYSLTSKILNKMKKYYTGNKMFDGITEIYTTDEFIAKNLITPEIIDYLKKNQINYKILYADGKLYKMINYDKYDYDKFIDLSYSITDKKIHHVLFLKFLYFMEQAQQLANFFENEI